MKRLLSNATSKAWVRVAVIGGVVVFAVLALQLIPRLGGGQEAIDALAPAFEDGQVAGERAGARFLAAYVELADPLVTSRGAAEVPELLKLIARRSRLSTAEVRATLRRVAPRTEALLRALPLADLTRELPSLESLLGQALAMPRSDVQSALADGFPHLSQMLAAGVPVANAWTDIPQPFERFDGGPVRTVPQLGSYVTDDIVGTIQRRKHDFQSVQGRGGIGYIPWLMLLLGLALIAFGMIEAQRARARGAPAPGRREWGAVAGAGALIVALVLLLSYFPRMSAADRLIDDFKPAFTAQRVSGAHEGIGLVNDAIRFADPIATRRGGAAVEVPSLLRFVSDRTGQTNREVLARLRSRAPHTAALLEAIPLQSVGDELTRLLPLLARKMRMGGSRLLLTLRKATPGLAQALERVPGVTTSWNAIAGTGQLERFDGSAPVRSAVELGEYLRSDVVAALEREQAHFDKLANSWPPVNFLPPLLLAVGLFTLGYGLYGMRALARR